jgi:hypothetical protein
LLQRTDCLSSCCRREEIKTIGYTFIRIRKLSSRGIINIRLRDSGNSAEKHTHYHISAVKKIKE